MTDPGLGEATARPGRPTFGTFHGLARAQPRLRRDGRDEAMAADHGRHRPAGAIRGSTRERGLLPYARRCAGAGARLRGAPTTVPTANVVVLSDGLWRRRFAGDAAILGSQVRLDDDPFTVIGVMPASFENVLGASAELWAPLQYDPSLPTEGREWGHHLRMLGRLRAGVSGNQARG